MPSALETIEARRNGFSDLLRLLRDGWRAALAFLLAAALAVIGLNLTVLPEAEPELGILGKKIDYLREHHGHYNVLFIGTSKTYRGVDPVLLQEVSQQHGCDVRAFNLGVSKLRLTELRHLAEQLSPAMFANYDLIFVSPMASSGIAAANWSSNRIRYFTDWEGYWVSLIDIWHVPSKGVKGIARKVVFSAKLTGAFVYRQLGIGQLATLFRGPEQAVADNESGDHFDGAAIVDFSRHGYVALDDEPHEQFLRRGEKILRNPGHFEGLKTRRAEAGDFRGSRAERAFERFTWTKEHLAEFDVPFAMFLPPMLPDRAQDQALAETAITRDVPVLNLNRLDLYPELFEIEHWFDYYHVGRSGAELLTTRIGERICPLIEQAKG